MSPGPSRPQSLSEQWGFSASYNVGATLVTVNILLCVCSTPCVCSAVSMFHGACIQQVCVVPLLFLPPSLYSTVSIFHRVHISACLRQQCQNSTASVFGHFLFHRVQIPVASIFHRKCIPLRLYFTVSVNPPCLRSVYIPISLCSAISIFHHVYIPSLSMLHPPCMFCSVCTPPRLHTNTCLFYHYK